MHHPVLLQTVIEVLEIKPGKRYIDATLGEGGYSHAILQKGGKVLAIDLDIQQIDKFVTCHPELVSEPVPNSIRESDLKQMPKRVRHDIVFIQGNFADLEQIAKENDFYPVDGIVFDLGLSMEQISRSGRGFSYKALTDPLDMRIDVNQENTAEFLINTLSKDALYNIFAKNSEEINSKAIADYIVKKRVKRRIKTVGDLTKIIDKVLGEKDNRVYGRIFQALRIEVNDEFENLKKGLISAVNTISNQGRIVVVTFHSLEDRIVKQFIKKNGFRELTKLLKGDRQKSFEKSAKLRVFCKSK